MLINGANLNERREVFLHDREIDSAPKKWLSLKKSNHRHGGREGGREGRWKNAKDFSVLGFKSHLFKMHTKPFVLLLFSQRPFSMVSCQKMEKL